MIVVSLSSLSVIQNGTKCSEDVLLRTLSEKSRMHQVDAIEILRFALDDNDLCC